MSFRSLLGIFTRRLRVETNTGAFYDIGYDETLALGPLVATWGDPGTPATAVDQFDPGVGLRREVRPDGTNWAAQVFLGYHQPTGSGTVTIQAGRSAVYGPTSVGAIELNTDGTSNVRADGARVHTNATVTTDLVRATAQLTLTGAAQLIPGLTVDVDIEDPADALLIDAVADLAATAGATLALATLHLDGVAQPGDIVLSEGSGTNRATPGQHWLLTGLTAGAHTLELRARKTGGGGTGTARAVQSVLRVEHRRA